MKNFEKVEKKLVEEKLKEIVKHNLEILEKHDEDQGSASQDERFVEFKSTNGHNIYNPFVDEGSIKKVNPIEHYGEETIMNFIEDYFQLKELKETKEKIKKLSKKEKGKILDAFEKKFECQLDVRIEKFFKGIEFPIYNFFISDSNFDTGAKGKAKIECKKIIIEGKLFFELKDYEFEVVFNFDNDNWGRIKKK